MSRAKAQKKSTIGARSRPGTELTSKEVRILKWSARGCNMAETADRLGMSRHGVDWYLRQIHSKLRVKTTTHAVYIALRQGLIG
jgi:LuxR family quorum sensing-dependent transcriptional regulator